LRESLRGNASAGEAARLICGIGSQGHFCQEETPFPEDFLELLLTACVYRWTHVENLWISVARLWAGRLLSGADQSQRQAK
jgi:hypothetical protein